MRPGPFTSIAFPLKTKFWLHGVIRFPRNLQPSMSHYSPSMTSLMAPAQLLSPLRPSTWLRHARCCGPAGCRTGRLSCGRARNTCTDRSWRCPSPGSGSLRRIFRSFLRHWPLQRRRSFPPTRPLSPSGWWLPWAAGCTKCHDLLQPQGVAVVATTQTPQQVPRGQPFL